MIFLRLVGIMPALSLSSAAPSSLPLPDINDDQAGENHTLGHNWGAMYDPSSVEQTTRYAVWLSQYTTPSLLKDDALGGLAYCSTLLNVDASYLPAGMASKFPDQRYSCVDYTKRNTLELRSYVDDPDAGWGWTYAALSELLKVLIRNLPFFGHFTPTFRITISNGLVMYAQGGWYPQLLKDDEFTS